MANYTAQQVSESGSFSQPQGSDVHHAGSLADLDWLLDQWEYQHSLVGSDSSDASLMVWCGKLNNVQDIYPDFICRRGRRGGLVRETC
jgi:hypothetical protein